MIGSLSTLVRYSRGLFPDWVRSCPATCPLTCPHGERKPSAPLPRTPAVSTSINEADDPTETPGVRPSELVRGSLILRAPVALPRENEPEKTLRPWSLCRVHVRQEGRRTSLADESFFVNTCHVRGRAGVGSICPDGDLMHLHLPSTSICYRTHYKSDSRYRLNVAASIL